MTVAIGSAARVLLDGNNLSCFFRELTPSLSKEILDATALCHSERQKVVGLKHAVLSGEAFADDTATIGSYDALKSQYVSSSAGILTYGPQGFALGSRILTMYSLAAKFDIQAAVDDLVRLMFQAEAASNAADFGVSLHDLTAETSFPFTGTAVDNLAATTNGGVATLHVTAIAGASPNAVYKVQHAAVATYADLVTFTAVTAANTAQRIEVAAGTTVNRNLRTLITDGGTTTSVTGLVTFSRR